MWQIRLTSLEDVYDYVILEEYDDKELAERMLVWYQNKSRFFNGTLSLGYRV